MKLNYNLHSTIFRFVLTKLIKNRISSEIYIPLFLDLYQQSLREPQRQIVIYIPLFLDLYLVGIDKDSFFTNIYIPLFLDLYTTEK